AEDGRGGVEEDGAEVNARALARAGRVVARGHDGARPALDAVHGFVVESARGRGGVVCHREARGDAAMDGGGGGGTRRRVERANGQVVPIERQRQGNARGKERHVGARGGGNPEGRQQEGQGGVVRSHALRWSTVHRACRLQRCETRSRRDGVRGLYT